MGVLAGAGSGKTIPGNSEGMVTVGCGVVRPLVLGRLSACHYLGRAFLRDGPCWVRLST